MLDQYQTFEHSSLVMVLDIENKLSLELGGPGIGFKTDFSIVGINLVWKLI